MQKIIQETFEKETFEMEDLPQQISEVTLNLL